MGPYRSYKQNHEKFKFLFWSRESKKQIFMIFPNFFTKKLAGNTGIPSETTITEITSETTIPGISSETTIPGISRGRRGAAAEGPPRARAARRGAAEGPPPRGRRRGAAAEGAAEGAAAEGPPRARARRARARPSDGQPGGRPPVR